jgi:hypothetical protein
MLDNAFAINPNLDEIGYSEAEKEEKDDCDNTKKIDADCNHNKDEEENDPDGPDYDEDDNEFYRSSLFDDDNYNSIGYAAYQAPSAKGDGAGLNPKV